MSTKISFFDTINPKTAPEIKNTIKQIFWMFILMVLSLAFRIGTSLWIVMQTGIDDVGSLPGTYITSFSGLASALLVDFAILVVAIIFFRWKKSTIAAGVILVIALWKLYNVFDAYFISEVGSIRITSIILPFIYTACAIIGLIATSRWKKLQASGEEHNPA